jgi:hypothetical protein
VLPSLAELSDEGQLWVWSGVGGLGVAVEPAH